MYSQLGNEELKLGFYGKSIGFYSKAYKLYKDKKLRDKQIEIVLNISRVYVAANEQDSAMKIVLTELKQNQGNTRPEAILLNRLGVILKESKNFEKAMTYLLAAEEKFKQFTGPSGVLLNSYIDNDKNLGVLYRNNKDYDKALFYLNRSLRNAESINSERWIGVNLNSLGILYMEMKDYPKAIECLEKSIKLKSEANHTTGMITSLNNLGNLYTKVNDMKKAEKCISQCIKLADSLQNLRAKYSAYDGAYNFYEKTGNKDKAHSFLKQAYTIKDSLFNSNRTAESAKLEAMYENEKKSKEIELTNFKNEELNKNLELKSRNQKILIGGALLLLAFSGWAIWSNIGKRKANKLLNQKNEEVIMQRTLVEHQNKEIVDSINYAQKIQTAILPKEMDLKNVVKDAFVFFKPRNIVSGDFYWLSEKDKYIFYVTADCTGHGVPGGFMSMLASSLLNEIVNEGNVNEPAEILNILRQRIIQALKQKGEVGENKDGMDMSICRINRSTKELVTAAANNPVWIIKGSHIQIIKPDKFPVGISSGDLIPFTQKTFIIEPDSTIYTFTDGYPDQFGGPNGKKFMYKAFQEVLVSINKMNCDEQQSVLSEKFDLWKGNLEQVDDVCVIGVKI